MITVFLAEGFEEIEALATIDVLRRAGLDTVTVGIGGRRITGGHGLSVEADTDRLPDEAPEAVVLPGGMPGTLHLEASPLVQQAIDGAVARGALICAICAAPTILGHRGLLDGKRAVCYPGMETELGDALVQKGAAVVEDDRFITAAGPGASIDFALAIVRRLRSPEAAAKLRVSMQCR